MAVRKNKAQTKSRGYDPKRKVTSSVARDVKKNADAFQVSGDTISAVKAIMTAGLEPKIKPKAKSKIGNTKTKRVAGSGLKQNSKTTTSTPRKTRGGGSGRGGSGGGNNGGWVTIKGNRINLGGKK